MDPKLALLFLLIGAVISLSQFDSERASRMGRQLLTWRWRTLVPRRRP
jgi:hypothetical protein